jgi:hypothetical protein
LVKVLTNYEVLDHLAGRIEVAYSLRRPLWWRGCSTTRVWYSAALRLWEAHAADPAQVPLDAELFVASQPISALFSDPWTEIAHSESIRRYRSAVRQIVQQLRVELTREVGVAERSIRRGGEIDNILGRKHARLSPLGSYILARRAGRDDLAKRYARAAASQHQSCPLYRLASVALIPADTYPDERLTLEIEQPVSRRVAGTEVTLRGKFREFCEN